MGRVGLGHKHRDGNALGAEARKQASGTFQFFRNMPDGSDCKIVVNGSGQPDGGVGRFIAPGKASGSIKGMSGEYGQLPAAAVRHAFGHIQTVNGMTEKALDNAGGFAGECVVGGADGQGLGCAVQAHDGTDLGVFLRDALDFRWSLGRRDVDPYSTHRMNTSVWTSRKALTRSELDSTSSWITPPWASGKGYFP